jgi:hypothetical protein
MAAMVEVPAIAVLPTEAFFSENASVIGKFVTQINCIYTEVLIFILIVEYYSIFSTHAACLHECLC